MRCRWRRPHGPPTVPILLDDPGAREGVHGEACPTRPRHLVSSVRPPLAIRLQGLRETEALPWSRILRAQPGVLLPRVRGRTPRGLEEILGVDVLVPPEMPVAGRAPPCAGPTRVRETAPLATAAPVGPSEAGEVAPGGDSRPGGLSGRPHGGGLRHSRPPRDG